MTSLPAYKAPFIFANWNNTSADVDVLTHECGHAFEGYVAERDPKVPADLECPGMESAEIHSMAMEFLTAPWHHLLFGKDTEKYALLHAEDSFLFLAYGCIVDEFQHRMYQNPDLTPDERNAVWLELEHSTAPGSTSTTCPSTAAAQAGSVSSTSMSARSIISTTACPLWPLCSSSCSASRTTRTPGSATSDWCAAPVWPATQNCARRPV